jgi:Asp-tRNA(Asn)/Glu-tRNA(Gln) amidotransferase A subunit family amidase
MKELWKLDAFAISKLFKKREVSAVEICEQTITHIQNTNPKINAIVIDTFEEAKKNSSSTRSKIKS